jgi:hypothetical protein
MKTSELEGVALDWAVAKCEGHDVEDETWWVDFGNDCCYSTDWAQGGPIIERERITLVCAEGEYNQEIKVYDIYWVAERGKRNWDAIYGPQGDNWGDCFQIDAGCMSGSTPLIAAMRCYVESKLGDEVDVPDELKGGTP